MNTILSLTAIALSTSLAAAQVCTPDAFEPNDSCAQAPAIAAGVHSGLTIPQGGIDTYRIVVPAAHRLEARVRLPAPSNVFGTFRLVLDNGAATPCDSPDEAVAFTFVEGGNTEFLLSWSASPVTPTAFYVGFETLFEACQSYELDLRFVPDPCAAVTPDVFEPNDSCASAAPISSGLIGGLDVAVAAPDFFAVSLAPNELVSFAVAGLASGQVVDLFAWDAAGPCGPLNVIYTGTAVYGPSSTGVYLFNAGASTTHYVLQVIPRPNQGTQTGFCTAYSLDVRRQFDPCGMGAGDAFEPNGDCASAPALSSSQTALSIYGGDRDWYAIDVPARSSVRLTTESTSAQIRYMTLLAGCTSWTPDFLMSSHPIYYDADQRQHLVWSNASAQSRSTRLYVHPPQGAFPAAFCDVYDLAFGITLGTPFCIVKRNSTGEGARISASGSTTPGQGTLQLTVAPLPANKIGIVIMSRAEQSATPFGKGYLCLAAPIVRHPVTTTGAGTMNVTLDWTGASAQIAPGDTWSFQAWFRDPAAAGGGTNTSDAVRVVFP